MYRCSKCNIIFNDVHKDNECREELLYNITRLIEKFSTNQLLIIYNFIKEKFL